MDEICTYGYQERREYGWVGGYFDLWSAHPRLFSDQVPPRALNTRYDSYEPF